MAGLNELMAEIHETGASLVVEKHMVGIKGKVSDRLRDRVRENREALAEYLTYDQEAAYELLRAARAYVSERYRTGSELDTDLLDHLIEEAMVIEDMWALRIAIRRWVLAWLEAIDKAHQQRRYLKLEIEKRLAVDKDARIWIASLSDRSDRYLQAQLWQVEEELGDRGVRIENREVLAVVLVETAKEIGRKVAA